MFQEVGAPIRQRRQVLGAGGDLPGSPDLAVTVIAERKKRAAELSEDAGDDDVDVYDEDDRT